MRRKRPLQQVESGEYLLAVGQVSAVERLLVFSRVVLVENRLGAHQRRLELGDAVESRKIAPDQGLRVVVDGFAAEISKRRQCDSKRNGHRAERRNRHPESFIADSDRDIHALLQRDGFSGSRDTLVGLPAGRRAAPRPSCRLAALS
jgi:hypothetical protein